jgi:hydroxymethylbilane synthase
MHIRIATRRSELALWQANHVAGLLRASPGVTEVTLVPMTTRGDEALDRSLQTLGGKGLFIKELEIAMQGGAADIAVHSMKDVPAELPGGFCIAAVLERGNPFDALVSRTGCTFDQLPPGATIGSSSLRRLAQLLSLRADLEVRPLRGNVNSRLARLDTGQFDAIVLACAGLQRLGLEDRISDRFSDDRMLPASSQGVIGVECLADRRDLGEVLAVLEHAATRQTTSAERAVARHLRADCRSPLASYAVVQDDELTLDALVASTDGRTILRRRASGSAAEPETLGREVADGLRQAGATRLLQAADPA